METFNYVKPTSLNEAIEALQKNDNAFVLAGGTDLLVKMKYRTFKPGCLVDIKAIPGIATVEQDQGWRFGALTTVRDIEVSSALKQKMPCLVQAAKALGSISIRNRATLGGNLCNASPCANFGAMFLALNARIKSLTPKGLKERPLQEFFIGPNETVLGKGEILTEIIVPEDDARSHGIFLKFSVGKSNDLGLVNIAIALQRDARKNLCHKIGIAMGAVAPVPMRAPDAEAILTQKPLTDELIARAAKAAADEAAPISDHRASADYRRHLVQVMVAKGIRSVCSA
jgi:CO/xanthine dehydrogenase FAD-binding subunit